MGRFDEFEVMVAAKLDALRSAALIGAKDVLTVGECSMFTGYSVQTIYAMTSGREIPHYKRGNTLFFDKAELEAWLKGRPVPTGEGLEAEAARMAAARPAGRPRRAVR